MHLQEFEIEIDSNADDYSGDERISDSSGNFRITYISNNPDDFDKIYNKLYSSVYFYAMRFVEQNQAADITSDVFHKFFLAARPFKNLVAAKSYLQTSVRNQCINEAKYKKWREKKEAEIIYLSEYTDSDSTALEIDAAFIDRIHQEVQKLAPQCRRVFMLHCIEGKSIKQVAQIMKISAYTVKAHKARAKAALRQKLAKFFISLAYFFGFCLQ